MKPRGLLSCNRPDRDVPGIECGYPLPCPHHTLVLDVESMTVSVSLHRGARLGDIANALRSSREPPPKRARRRARRQP